MKSIAITAVAGLAVAASAQGVTLHFDVDGDPLTGNSVDVNVGDTVTWNVLASFTGYDPADGPYFGGISGPEPDFGQFIASDSSLGTAGNFMNLMAGTGVPAMANGATVFDINIFNSALLGTDDPANPLAIFNFDVSTSGVGQLSYSASGVATVFPDDGIFTLGDEFTQFTIITDTVNIVPAPGAFALLGLGGLAAARRRR